MFKIATRNINNMRTKYFLTIIAAALAVTANAQQSLHDNYVGASVGGGLNTMLYETAHGHQDLGMGIGAGLFYGRFFNKTIGLGLGLQYTRANAYTTYNWKEVTNGLIHPDNPNTTYNLMTGFDNFKERQSIGYLSIPVEVLFRKALNSRLSMIGGVGMALDFPLNGKYVAKSGSYSTTGVFPEITDDVFHDMPEHGFSTYTTTQGAKFNNYSKVGASVIGDIGARMALNDNLGLYVGIYAGYGVTNLLSDDKQENMLSINDTDPSVIDYRGTFGSRECSKVNLLRCGLKVAIDFGWSGRSGKAAKDMVQNVTLDDELRIAAEKARQDSIANARAKAESERLAREKALRDRLAAEKAAQEAEAAKMAAEKARVEALKKKVELVNVHFDIARADMHFQEGEQLIVDDICRVMAKDPSMKIVITGHTDNTGSAKKNRRVWGMKRAEALRDYMVDKGVPVSQIRCESKGETEPVADNATRQGRALNRRANIRFE